MHYICDPSRRNGHFGGMTPNWVIDTSLKTISQALKWCIVEGNRTSETQEYEFKKHIYSYYFLYISRTLVAYISKQCLPTTCPFWRDGSHLGYQITCFFFFLLTICFQQGPDCHINMINGQTTSIQCTSTISEEACANKHIIWTMLFLYSTRSVIPSLAEFAGSNHGNCVCFLGRTIISRR